MKMCTRLINPEHLTALRSWLKSTNGPCDKVAGHLESKIRGQMDCEVLVNTWPHPSVVLIAPSDKPPTFKFLGNTYSVFATNKTDLDWFLSEDKGIKWDGPLVFCAIDTRLADIFKKHAERHGLIQTTESLSQPCYSYHRTSRESVAVSPLSDNLKVSALIPSDARTVASTWEWASDDTERYVEFLIHNFPTVGVRDIKTDTLIAWELTQHYWALGMGYTLPKYRRTGLMSHLFNYLLNAVNNLDDKIDLFSFVEKTNTVSLRLCEKIGFVRGETEVQWLKFEPVQARL